MYSYTPRPPPTFFTRVSSLMIITIFCRRKSSQKIMWRTCRVIYRYLTCWLFLWHCLSVQLDLKVFRFPASASRFILFFYIQRISWSLNFDVIFVCLQKVTDEYMKKVDSIYKQKEKVLFFTSRKLVMFGKLVNWNILLFISISLSWIGIYGWFR